MQWLLIIDMILKLSCKSIHQWYIIIGTDPWEVDGVASDPPWFSLLHNFPSKLHPDSISGLECRLLKLSWSHAPRPLSKSTPSKMLSVIYTLCELGQHQWTLAHFKFWWYVIFLINIWKTQLSWNLSQPPTLNYFWISAH